MKTFSSKFPWLPANAIAAFEAEMSKEIHVGVQPLRSSEWKELLEQEGFKVIWCGEADLDLLEPRRMLQGEGIFRCLKIACNVLSDSALRRRILTIRKIFRRYREHLGAISIVGLRAKRAGGSIHDALRRLSR